MTDTPPARHSRRKAILAVIAVVATLAGSGTAWFATRPNARGLFKQGLAVARRDPALGERLLRRAVQAAGGRYPDAELSLCQTLAKRGAWDEALSRFATVDREACRADLLLAFGREALRAEHRPEALQALEAASQRGLPASVAAAELLKAEYHESGQQDEETAAACLLTRMEPDNPDHWKSLLEMLAAQNKMVECEAALREALQQELPDAYRRNFEYMLIQILVGRDEVSESRRRIADLKQLEGRSFRLSVSEIELYRREGQWDLALAAARALSPDAKDLHIMYHLRGVVHLDLEQYEEAVRDFERAVTLRPFDERVHYGLSEAYRILRRGDLAAQHGKIAAEISAKRKRINSLLKQRSDNPRDPAIYGQLAELHAELGDERTAQHWQERARRLLQAQSNSR